MDTSTTPQACIAATSWQFPSSAHHSYRAYQNTMSKAAIFGNTLVSLPTGMGKTLIASVVLHNYLRFFPTGTVVFMAPTRPLVQQQIGACCSSVGLSPETDAMLLTGEDLPETRADLWKKRRLIFCTPHILRNDLASGLVDGRRIVLAIFDEAHHAASAADPYAEVARLLRESGAVFRTLALSATAGVDLSAVQRVVDLLHLSQAEQHTHSVLLARSSINTAAPLLGAAYTQRPPCHLPETEEHGHSINTAPPLLGAA